MVRYKHTNSLPTFNMKILLEEKKEKIQNSFVVFCRSHMILLDTWDEII